MLLTTRMFMWIFYIALCGELFIVKASFKQAKRVINGVDANPEDYPWIASLQSKFKFNFFGRTYKTFCGGALISERWILTAAHCFYLYKSDEEIHYKISNPKKWHIRMASSKLKPNLYERLKGIFYRIINNKRKRRPYYHAQKIFIHPKYNPNHLEYDIAMIKLKERVPIEHLPGASTIKLPKQATLGEQLWPIEGEDCSIVGWGCNKAGGAVHDVAQQANLTILSPQFCRRVYRTNINLTIEHEFCAGYHQRGIGICPGDSGSILACQKESDWIASGVTSATHSILPAEYPGIFTRISYFVDWISNISLNN